MGSPGWSWRWIPQDRAACAERADKAIHEAIAAGLGEWSSDSQTLSRSRVQALMKEGAITQSGKPLESSSRLKLGETVEVQIPKSRPLTLVPEERELAILYEDSDILVINKPAGLTVHPSETQSEGTLVHALLHHVKDLSGIGGTLRPGIVHRLDKDTSGALVVTKTDRAHSALSEVFSQHAIERRYWALCYGAAPGTRSSKEQRIESTIGRNPADRKKMAMNVRLGRKATTYVRSIESFSNFACLLEARLETGRTHQVRVHLTGIQHSILGDPVYGVPSKRSSKWLALPEEIREAVSSLPGQALHARVLGFRHPITGEELRFEAPLPPAFADILARLEKFSTSR